VPQLENRRIQLAHKHAKNAVFLQNYKLLLLTYAQKKGGPLFPTYTPQHLAGMPGKQLSY
jgi:hypothetical protein